MHSRPTCQGWASRFGMAAIIGFSAAAAWEGPVTLGQAPGKPAEPIPRGKELEAAAQKVREGRNDEALGLIKAQAAQHLDWPPPQLILARLLFDANQAVPGRRALEQAAVEAPRHPEVYLTFGTMALTEGRLSDARLNFEHARSLIGSGPGDGARARGYRREVLAGLAAVAEAREDWLAAQGYLNTWLELEPKTGPARQRLGAVLFRLGKSPEAFAALKQAVQDTPTLEPAAITMARLLSQRGDRNKAEEWFDYALKLEPSSARVRLARAAWLLDQGRAAAARPEIDEAVKLDPAWHEARRVQ
ncbi:MAG TPA: tetratricopeptide repeat protein, partial [Isosphaeraceae bacterium]|nr:tetratricopeptide repeat protein [Isosphaeraceae bacterium]